MSIVLDNQFIILLATLTTATKYAADVAQRTYNMVMLAIRRCENCGTPLSDGQDICHMCGWDNVRHKGDGK